MNSTPPLPPVTPRNNTFDDERPGMGKPFGRTLLTLNKGLSVFTDQLSFGVVDLRLRSTGEVHINTSIFVDIELLSVAKIKPMKRPDRIPVERTYIFVARAALHGNEGASSRTSISRVP